MSATKRQMEGHACRGRHPSLFPVQIFSRIRVNEQKPVTSSPQQASRSVASPDFGNFLGVGSSSKADNNF